MTEKEKQYRAHPALHYSLLAQVEKDITKVGEISDELYFGSVVDKLFFEEEDFKNDYYVIDFKKPSDAIAEIIEEVFEEIGDNKDRKFDSYAEQLIKKAREKEWNKRYGDDAIFNNLKKSGEEYFNNLDKTKGYQVITKDEYGLAKNICSTLKYHAYTEKIFNPGKDWEVKIQEPYFATINGIEYKVLLDHVAINHKDQIIQPNDLKITDWDFEKTIRMFKFYLQASLYTDVLQSNFPDYKILPFKFIVMRRFNPTNPLIYPMNLHDLGVGRNGGKDFYGNEVRGYQQLAEDYLWHKEHNKWDDQRKVYENEGIINLNLFQNYKFPYSENAEENIVEKQETF